MSQRAKDVWVDVLINRYMDMDSATWQRRYIPHMPSTAGHDIDTPHASPLLSMPHLTSHSPVACNQAAKRMKE